MRKTVVYLIYCDVTYTLTKYAVVGGIGNYLQPLIIATKEESFIGKCFEICKYLNNVCLYRNCIAYSRTSIWQTFD